MSHLKLFLKEFDDIDDVTVAVGELKRIRDVAVNTDESAGQPGGKSV